MAQQCEAVPVSDPSVAPPPDGLHADDQLIISRQHVCEGEALRAVADYSPLDFATPPTPAVLALLDVAYGHMQSIRPAASPEDFAVYVFSLLRECCLDKQEEEELKIAAARYIVEHIPCLSADFAEFVPQAQALLAQIDAESADQDRLTVEPDHAQPLLLMGPIPPDEAPAPDMGRELRAVRSEVEARSLAAERTATARKTALGALMGAIMVLSWMLYATYWPGTL